MNDRIQPGDLTPKENEVQNRPESQLTSTDFLDGFVLHSLSELDLLVESDHS